MKDDIIRISFQTLYYCTACFRILWNEMEQNDRSFLRQSGENISWYFVRILYLMIMSYLKIKLSKKTMFSIRDR